MPIPPRPPHADSITRNSPAAGGEAGAPHLTAGQRVRVAGDLFHPRVPAGARYIGRGAPGLRASRYANPHRVGACRRCSTIHDQIAAVQAYAHDLDQAPDLVAGARAELAGIDLACWCRSVGGPCHGDVLLLVVAGVAPLAALTSVLQADSDF